MSDDFSMGQAMGDTGGGGQPSPEEQNAGAAVAATGSYLEKTAANAKNQADADQVESTYNAKTHTWSLDNVPHDALQTILQNAKQFGHITQIYQQQIDRNQQQQEQLRQHPFANALAQIAANVGAASKDPLVRGLGGAAQALNPTMGQLQGQGMELMQGAEKAGEGQIRIMEQLDQHQSMRQNQENIAAQREDASKRATEEKRRATETQFNTKWDQRSAAGAFDKKTFGAEYKQLFPDASQAAIDAMSAGHELMAAQHKADQKTMSEEKAKDRAAIRDAQYQAKIAERSEEH